MPRTAGRCNHDAVVLSENDEGPPPLRLRWSDPRSGEPRVLDLPRFGEVTFGRQPTCDVVFAHSFVSRRHFMIRATRESVSVIDTVSAGGTYVNDRIVRTHALQDGDVLVIGGDIRITVSRRG